MKRTMNRLFLRLVMLCIAVILGVMAVAHAQRGLNGVALADTSLETNGTPMSPVQPIGATGGESNSRTATPPNGFSEPGSYAATTYGSNQSEPQSALIPTSPPEYGVTTNPTELATNSTGYPESNYETSPPAEPNDVATEYSANNEPAYDAGGAYAQSDFAPPPANAASEPEYAATAPAYSNESQDYGTPAANNYAAAPADDFSAGNAYDANAYQADLPANQVTPVNNDVLEAAPPTQVTNPFTSEPELPAPPTANDNAAMGGYEEGSVLPPLNQSTPEDQPALPAIDEFPVQPEPAMPAAQEPPAYGNSYDGGYDANKPQSGGYGTTQFAPDHYAANETQELQPTPPAGFDAPTPSTPSPFSSGNRGATLQATPEPATNSYGSSVAGSPEPSGAVGNGKPGPPQLEGPQTPSLTVTKSAPREIQVGKPAKFQVFVRNVGSVDAHDVLIRDEVPEGAQLVQTNPPASRTADGAILWQMGTVKAGAEVSATMEVMPMIEGDIGSVATVSFQTSASARSLATKPQLVLEHTGPGKVLVGDDVVFHIKLSNPGTGVAHNVVIEEDVPNGLRHFDGPMLEYPVGTIRPGETRLLELTLKADQPGMVNNTLVAKADSNLAVKDDCQLEIVAPQLQVGIDGPSRRYLERRANFQVKVANPGTASARDVELVARLPRGLKFVSTNNAGQYNSQEHAVYWSLTELGAQKMGTVQLVAVPTDMGDQRIRIESRANMGLNDATEHNLTVEGLAAMLFTVTDVNDPIEVTGQTTYEIHILNQGSKVGTNLQLGAILPEGMEAINGEGPTRVNIEGNRIVFEPLARLAPQADTLYKIHARGTTPGDKRIQVQLMSDDVSQPVTKEESTHVYSDQ